MSLRISLLAIFLSVNLLFGEAPSVQQVQPLFIKGKEAYDQDQFTQAADHYEAIIATGTYAPEVFYNLGNTYFRLGKFGLAILNYKRSQYLAPLDSSTEANIRFAQKQAGAIIPNRSVFEKSFSLLTRNQWLTSVIIMYWIGCACLAAYFLLGRPPWLRKLTLSSGFIFTLSGFGLAGNAFFNAKPEAVILENGDALFAPLEDSEKHFTLPAGSIVRVTEESGGWMQVQSGKEKGWIPQKSCEMVSAW